MRQTRKEVKKMPGMTNINELRKIVLDFENLKFMINETNIGLYSEVKIKFKNGKWTVQLKSEGCFDRFGKMTNK